MPSYVSPQQLTVVEDIVARYPEGATADQIQENITPAPTERTMRRWLALLIERRRVERLSSARATRYRTLHPKKAAATNAGAPAPTSTTHAAPHAQTAAPVSTGDMTEQIFTAAIGDIVRGALPRRTAVDYLQRLTERNIASIDDRRAALTLIKEWLDAFTAEDAERYGFDPEQYQRWRAQHDMPADAPGSATGAQPTHSDTRGPGAIMPNSSDASSYGPGAPSAVGSPEWTVASKRHARADHSYERDATTPHSADSSSCGPGAHTPQPSNSFPRWAGCLHSAFVRCLILWTACPHPAFNPSLRAISRSTSRHRRRYRRTADLASNEARPETIAAPGTPRHERAVDRRDLGRCDAPDGRRRRAVLHAAAGRHTSPPLR